MNSFTKILLILLRVAIGWHLLFAGLAKFQSDYKGSEGYLQGAGGPAAPLFHRMIGDSLADKLAVDPDETKPARDRFPPALAVEWNDYYDAFAARYNLDADQQRQAQDKINTIKDAAVKWMTTTEVTIGKSSPYGPSVEYTRKVPDWVKDYQAKRQQIRNAAAGDYSYVAPDDTLGDNTKDIAALRKQVGEIRTELTKGVDNFNNDMKDALTSVLTPEQITKGGPFTAAVRPSWKHWSRMDWIDFAVRWGLVITGAGLILGFFTRLNCFGGALLLLSFYLAVPPLPGLPEAFRAEGYPYINKNIIEMLALLMLMTTRSGRWAGLDGLLYYLNPFRKKVPEPRQVVPGRPQTFAPYNGSPTAAVPSTRSNR